MVVDDHEDMRFLLRVIIGDHPDLEIVCEVDGVRRALEEIESADPDVVILDAIMPLMDGYQAAPRLRELRPDQTILLCTAHVDEVVRARAADAGIEHVIGKDQFAAIPAKVRELAGREPGL